MAGHGIFLKFFNSLGSCRNLLSSRITVALYQQQNAGLRSETKEKLKRLNVPEAPKRPLTPYFRFLIEHRPLVQKEHPDWKLMDITKQCAQDWKSINPSIKEKYQVAFNKELETYQAKHHQYTASLTEEQSEALQTARREKRSSKKKRLIKKINREMDRPKRPVGSFIYFTKEKWALPENKHKKLSELVTIVKDEWNKLSDAQKKKYIDLNEADRDRYKAEMKTWEKKMIQEGRTDIIRKESQIISEKPSHLKKHHVTSEKHLHSKKPEVASEKSSHLKNLVPKKHR